MDRMFFTEKFSLADFVIPAPIAIGTASSRFRDATFCV